MDSSVTDGHLCIKGRFGFSSSRSCPRARRASDPAPRGNRGPRAGRVRGQPRPPAPDRAARAAGRVRAAPARDRGRVRRAGAPADDQRAQRAGVADPDDRNRRIVVALVRVGGEWWSPGDNRARGEPSPAETGSPSCRGTSNGVQVAAGRDRRDPRRRQPLRPQVVALQELDPDVAAALEASAEIDQRFPYRILEGREDVRGMGILSSIPLGRGRVWGLPHAAHRRPGHARRVASRPRQRAPATAEDLALAGVPVSIPTRRSGRPGRHRGPVPVTMTW